MIPLQPDLTVRILTPQDAPALATLLSPLLATTIYSGTMNPERAVAQALQPRPITVFPTRLRENRCLGLWRTGQLIGAIDVAVGFDSDTLDLPDYLPVGLLRFLALPERADLVDEAAALLFHHAEEFWRRAGVGLIRAFHLSTGYPAFQAGAGLLPGEWHEHVRLLTEAGYRFSDRYYAVHRPVGEPVEEHLAMADSNLVLRGSTFDRRYALYYRRTEQIGMARLVRSMVDREGAEQAIGLIAALYIDPHWRQRDLGKWLLSRMINDAYLLAYAELVVFVSTGQSAALNLFSQVGFEELHYRGYVLEKTLTK